MRTQPEYLIRQLEIHNSRINKEQILEAAVEEGLDEFFEGLRMALDGLYTFGVKQVPTKDKAEGQGLSWINFVELADSLYRRNSQDTMLAMLFNWPWMWPHKVNGTIGIVVY